MRAAVYRRFGGPDTVGVEEIPRPSVGPDDVLIRVQASTVSAADHRARSREVPRGLGLLAATGIGLLRPKRRVLGMDAAGVVEAIGRNVTRFAPGDEVIAMLGADFGGHAEYARIRSDGAIALKPRTMTFEDAVTLVFGGLTARGFLRQAHLVPGATVLVNGASGAVGTAVVQLAEHAGGRVTAVCSGPNRELVTSLGADRVIDHTTEDFTAERAGYDVIVDCVGNAPYERAGPLLRPGGALLLVVADLPAILRAPVRSRRSGHRVTADGGKPTADDLAFLVALAEAGAYRAVRDRTFDLAEIVEAHRYVDTGHKRGNVVLRLTGGPGSTTSSIQHHSREAAS
ncbi:NAD(P)-dependent alcohol dehydrogenase [Geodermatophilus normandii]|uniref:NAD(P)-dependent alcohol dehydrogenase n=1 Tax=Geodermatophilus normandii TaxID=1137989 RepID=A0A6P0GLZ4_9ACTN|nr:NAD(P)-dependent alcohol dehydrogenase [Geodermatophilus normandii]NEM06633.1 NAD(P)-dependent alcohol dehydrogenase [Geodermatophilus normandii]NEM08357.1 NAD(P)-dependent alcohol dehydrogenase [Geodermatophilus normandii]